MSPPSSTHRPPERALCLASLHLGLTLALALALAAAPHPGWGQEPSSIFDPDATYRIRTSYGQATDLALSGYLAEGVTGATFALKSCETSRSDYYATATVTAGKLMLTSNTLGHIHGTHTESETTCTVTGTVGTESEDQNFALYTVSARAPPRLTALALVEARPLEVDIRVTPNAGSGFIRLGWRKAGGQVTFRVVSGVTGPSVVTIPSLERSTAYQIRAYQMTKESFDLYRSGNTGAALTLISESTPAAKWLSNLSGSGLGKSSTLSVTTPTPALSIADTTVTEGTNAEALFTVTLDRTIDRAVTVAYATSNGTATAGADYTAATGTLTIAANDTTGTITVAILDDTIDEDDETFTVTLTNPSNATVSDGAGTGTITDDDAAPTLSIDDVTVAEAAGAEATFTVRLSTASGREVTVAFATSNGSATADADYTAATGTLTIAAAATTGTIAVAILDDTIDEDDETFTVTLTSPTNATVSDDAGTGTITDDDLPPTLSIDDVTVAEAAGAEATFTVTLSTATSKEVTVAFATSNGTATAGADYTAATGTLTIAAAATAGTITVAILDDTVTEADETFTVTLTSPSNATVSDDAGTGTITEDDLPPTLSIDDVTVAEAASAEATFTVTLSTATSNEVTVAFASSNGTATSGADYTAATGTLTIAAGATAGTIAVAILQDTIDEDDETFTVTLTSPSNATVSDGDGTGTITDDDAAPTLSIDDVTVAEAASAEATFTVTLSTASGREVTVAFATSNGTATADADYTAATGTLTIAAGATAGTIAVAILQDTIDEDDETFTVTLTSPSNATVSDGDGTGTITDDDAAPTLSIDDVTVAEAAGAEATFTVRLSTASGREVTVAFATSNGTATADADYTAATGTLTIAAGATAGTIAVAILQDTIDEDDETFTVTLTSPSNATVSDGDGTGTITDDDAAPTLSIDDVTVTEAPGAEATFTVTLNAASGRQVTVEYATSNGTANAGDDYTAATGTLTIAAGDTTGTVTVAILQDTIGEADETFTVTLTNPSAATVSDGDGTGTIADPPPTVGTPGGTTPLTVRVDDARVREGADAQAEFVVRLSGAAPNPITIDYSTSNGTAIAGSDYTETRGTVTIAAGDTEASIFVPIVDDDDAEPDETFTLALSNPTGAAIERGDAVGTILDTDETTALPTMTIADTTVTEGGDAQAEFVVRLSGPATNPITIDYSTSDGTAIAGSDYTETRGTVTIAAGDTEASIFVPIVDDDAAEPGETFTLALSNPTGAAIERGDAVGTILDTDDGPTATPAISIADTTVTEGADAAAVFVVTLNFPAKAAIQVDYATTDGSATAGGDYTAASGTMVIGPGRTEATLRVAILDDGSTEPDETFVVTLGNPAGATVDDGKAVGTILDDDEPEPTLTIQDVVVTEGEHETADFTVVLSATSANTVTVRYATSDGSATAGADYVSARGTLVIPAGEVMAVLPVALIDDATDEPNETLAVILSNPTGAVTEDGEGKGTIIDNDEPPAIGIGDAEATEGSDPEASFPVTLSRASSFAVTVRYRTLDGTATASDDYRGAAGTLTVRAGRRRAAIAVPVIDDMSDEPDETFTVRLSDPRNARLSDPDGFGRIIDDDEPPLEVAWERPLYSVREGRRTGIAVVLNRVPGRRVVIPLTDTPGTDVTTSDYSGVPASLAFGPRETRKALEFLALPDDEYEGAEALVLGFGALPPGVVAANPRRAAVIIEDDYSPNREGGEWNRRFGREVASQIMLLLDDRMKCAPDRGVEEADAGVEQGGARDGGESTSPAPAEVTAPRRRRWRCRPPYGDRTSVRVNGQETNVATANVATANVATANVAAANVAIASLGAVAGSGGGPTVQPFGFQDPLFAARHAGRRPDVAFEATSEAGPDGSSLGLWGRGSFSSFRGAGGAAMTLDGDVETATVGADYATGRWLTGVALSHGRGEGSISHRGFEADATAHLSGLYPYVRYGANQRLSLWGIAGYGTGAMELRSREGRSLSAGSTDFSIAMAMGAAGARAELIPARENGEPGLHMNADALFVRAYTERVPGPGTAEADMTRLRLALEGAFEFVSENDAWFSPFLEAGLRHDGGDAETGFGIEVGGGARYGHPGLNLMADLNARVLVAHETEGLSEWGLSASLRYDQDPSSDRGASLTVTPSWGEAGANGVATLWETGATGHLAYDRNRPVARAVDTEVAFGVPILDGRATGASLGGLSVSATANEYHVGYRLTFGMAADIALKAALLDQSDGRPSEYRLLLRGTLSW